MLFRPPRYVSALILGGLLLFTASAPGQEPPHPYATLDRYAVNYAGPGREAADDLTGSEVMIGLVAPLAGPRKAEGEALLAAAQLAMDDERLPLPEGRHVALLARDESGPWGRASSEIVRLVVDDRAVALITSADGGMAHLAEQVANKIGVPIVTLSSDRTTTQINLPWVFRMGPTDAAQARVFARAIYRERGFHRVFLVTENDHDGRLGGEAFEKAVKEIGGPLQHFELDASHPEIASVAQHLTAAKPEALVLWTGPETSAKLVGGIRQAGLTAPVYLCLKATQDPFREIVAETCPSCRSVAPGGTRPDEIGSPASSDARLNAGPSKNLGELWTASLSQARPNEARQKFERRYRERTGEFPSSAALEAYDAVRMIAAALRQSGANRARLRDRLATFAGFPGVSGTITFDPAGNDLSGISLLALH